MNIRGYSWAGAPTSDFERTCRFFREDLGLEVLVIDDIRIIGIFKLPTGQLFEIFGPGIAFDVDTIDTARAELERKGVKFVSEIERGSHGDAWTFFEGPDGYLYQLFQRSSKPESKDAA